MIDSARNLGLTTSLSARHGPLENLTLAMKVYMIINELLYANLHPLKFSEIFNKNLKYMHFSILT